MSPVMLQQRVRVTRASTLTAKKKGCPGLSRGHPPCSGGGVGSTPLAGEALPATPFLWLDPLARMNTSSVAARILKRFDIMRRPLGIVLQVFRGRHGEPLGDQVLSKIRPVHADDRDGAAVAAAPDKADRCLSAPEHACGRVLGDLAARVAGPRPLALLLFLNRIRAREAEVYGNGIAVERAGIAADLRLGDLLPGAGAAR